MRKRERRDGNDNFVASKSLSCESKPSTAFGTSPALPQTALTGIKSRLITDSHFRDYAVPFYRDRWRMGYGRPASSVTSLDIIWNPFAL